MVEKEARQAAYRLHYSTHFKKITLGTIFYFQDDNGTQFYCLLLTVCYLWRYLIGNIWCNNPLEKYGCLKLKHGFLSIA
jgi:hypothetical protein